MLQRTSGATLHALLLSLALLLCATTASSLAQGGREPKLRDQWDSWLGAVEPLITAAEKSEFQALSTDLERERFLLGFWQRRPDAALERFVSNRRALREARFRAPVHSQVVANLGKPARVTLFDQCKDQLRRLELWHYPTWLIALQLGHAEEPGQVAPEPAPFTLALLQWSNLDPRRVELVEPETDFERWTLGQANVESLADALTLARSLGCRAGISETRPGASTRNVGRRALRPGEFEQSLAMAVSWDEALRRVPWPAPAPGGLEEAGFTQVRTRLPGRLRIEPLGRYGNRSVVVRGTVTLPIQSLARNASGQFEERISIVGDLKRNGRYQESLEIAHVLSGRPPTGVDDLELDFYRVLEPGEYELSTRITNQRELPLLRDSRNVSVPELTEPAVPPPRRKGGFARLARDELVLLTTFPTLELLDSTRLGDGRQQVTASAHGGAIASVEWRLDTSGQDDWTTDGSPPFRATFEIERPVTLLARARDDAGSILATTERKIWPSERPFRVSLTAPGATSLTALRDLAERGMGGLVEVPQGERLVRVDCLLGGSVFASVSFGEGSPGTASPGASDDSRGDPASIGNSEDTHTFRCPAFSGVVTRTVAPGDVAVVTATAILTNGASSSDTLVFSRHPIDQVNVRLNQFAVSVTDGSGAPVLGLSESDFEISAAGVAEIEATVESIDRLPLTLSVLLDTSSSMGRRLRVTSASCRRFFDSLLRDEDTSNLLAFNHDLRALAHRTSSKNQLRYAASGLSSWGATRVYDAMMHSISSFQSQSQRRAIVVLTDGADTESDVSVLEVEREALRSGIAIYAIALGALRDPYRSELERLARTTGGKLHTARTASQLDAAFAEISQGLRSMYLLTFEGEGLGDELEALDVEVLSPGARVTALTRLRSTD